MCVLDGQGAYPKVSIQFANEALFEKDNLQSNFHYNIPRNKQCSCIKKNPESWSIPFDEVPPSSNDYLFLT